MRYENEICQGCGKIMHENEDIVVCPECGTPQHRECYNAKHKCVNEHLHEDGFEWRAKHAEEPQVTFAEKGENKEKIICPFCRHENDADAKECSNCGQPFELFGRSIFPNGQQNYESVEKENRESEYTYKPPFEVETPKENENQYYAPVGDGFSHTGEEQESFNFNGHMLYDEIDGVKNKDMALYLRTSVPKYHEKFSKIQKGGKTFNWASFFFMPYWFFYRKLVKPGIIFMSLTLLLSVLFYNPMMEYMDFMMDFASESAIMNGETLTEEDIASMTDAELDALWDELQSTNEEYDALIDEIEKLMPYLGAYMALTLLLRIIAGFIADKMYMKKVVADIKETNASVSQDSNGQQAKYLAYMKKGGTSVGYAALSYGAEYVIGMIISAIMTTGMF